MNKYRLGLKPPRPDSVKLRLTDYLDHTAVLPQIPAVFGHGSLITNWGMLGNGPDAIDADVPVGDCAIAGPEHIIMGWAAAAGRPVPKFDYASTISMYSAITGYDPSQTQPDGSNPTDQGSDMTTVAEWWETKGFTDATGVVHEIATFLALEPGDLDQLAAAAYLFGAVGIGVQMPESAQEQFDSGQPWSVTNAPIEGGHFVPVIGRAANGNFPIVTWGAGAEATPGFITEYCTLPIVYVSKEQLNTKGLTPENFAWGDLLADLRALDAL